MPELAMGDAASDTPTDVLSGVLLKPEATAESKKALLAAVLPGTDGELTMGVDGRDTPRLQRGVR